MHFPSDIHPFLQEHIPSRFKALSDQEFGEFIQYLFVRDGYTAMPFASGPGFTRMERVNKGEVKMAVLALRFDPEHVVHENQVRKAQEAGLWLEADHTWIITTSSFSPEAEVLAEELGVEWWDWNQLYAAICQLFFEGKDHIEYREAHPLTGHTTIVPDYLSMKVKWKAAEGVQSAFFNLELTIKNTSSQHCYIHLELPALIDPKKNQIMADQWVDGEFVSGMIYSGASIRTNALFAVARTGDRPPGGRIVMTCHIREDTPVTCHLDAKLKGEACYVVTYCYTQDSKEYDFMIKFRDEVLKNQFVGRCFIWVYYRISPSLIRIASRYGAIDKILRTTVEQSVAFCMQRMKNAKFPSSHRFD